MFVRSPQLLVFDDLSSALDVETEQELWRRFFDILDPPAVIAVSHRRSVLQRADRIVLMENGEVAGVGKLDELLAEHSQMREMWEGGDAL
jgi:ATP-binding cassette subfamily B protein